MPKAVKSDLFSWVDHSILAFRHKDVDESKRKSVLFNNGTEIKQY